MARRTGTELDFEQSLGDPLGDCMRHVGLIGFETIFGVGDTWRYTGTGGFGSSVPSIFFGLYSIISCEISDEYGVVTTDNKKDSEKGRLFRLICIASFGWSALAHSLDNVWLGQVYLVSFSNPV